MLQMRKLLKLQGGALKNLESSYLSYGKKTLYLGCIYCTLPREEKNGGTYNVTLCSRLNFFFSLLG